MSAPRLLLVEDEVVAREVLARALQRAGYHCSCAGDVSEAQVAIEGAEDFDAAVFDVKLGDANSSGLDLLVPFRSRFSRAPVVVITAFADFDTVKRALNQGASYLLEKPFASADLLRLLAQLLGAVQDRGASVETTLRRARLTDKEAEVARLLLKGLPSVEIADVLAISEKTVRQHVSQIFLKCGVTRRAEFFHHVFPT